MINDEPAVPRLVAIDRRQLLLRTVDVEKLVDDEHSVRAIWGLIGRLDLRLYHAQIAAVEGSAGREHTDPQLLISLWLYAYSRESVRLANWRGSASMSRAASGCAACSLSVIARCRAFALTTRSHSTICSREC